MDITPLASIPASPSGQPATPVTPSTPAQTGNRPPVTESTPPGNPSEEKIMGAVNRVNASFAQSGQNLYASFEKDKDTGISVVKIVDRKTSETIRQMPAPEVLAFARSLEQQVAHGKLINTTA